MSFGNCSTAENTSPHEPVKALVDLLVELLAGRWPGRLRELCDPHKPQPLAIDIREHLASALGLDQGERYRLGGLLGKWTGRAAYLKALSAPGAQRYGLDGEPAAAVSPEHHAAALEQLERKRDRWQAKQRGAKAAACRANAAKPVLLLGASR